MRSDVRHALPRWSSLPIGRMLEIGLWSFLALALALFAGSGDWVALAFVLGVVALGVLLLAGTKTLAVAFIAVQPVLFVFPNNVASGVPFFSVERGLFLILLGTMIVRALIRAPNSRPLNRLEWLILAFLGVLVASFLVTVSSKEMKILRSDIALLFQCYLMPWLSILIARRIEWTELDVLRLLRLITLAGFLLFVIGVLQFFLHVPWFTPLSFEVIHEGRTTGTFGNAAEYGSVLAGMAVLTLAQFSLERSAGFRLVLLGCAGLMLGGVVICLTRSPLVGLAAAMTIVFLGDARIRPILTIMLVAGGVAALLLAPLVLDIDAVLARFEEMEPIYNRIALFATAGNMIAAHPFTGVGFGRYSFTENKTDYLTGVGEIGAEWAASIGIPHLEFVHIAVLTGLLGITVYLLLFRACIRTLWAVYADRGASPFARTLAIYVLALLGSLLANGLFVDFMAYNYFTTLVYFMVGVASVVKPNPDSAQGQRS